MKRPAELEALVAHDLGLSPQEKCRLGKVGEWIHGSFNVYILVYMDNWKRYPGKKLLLRIPQPYTIGESKCPGILDEKLRTEATTFIWIHDNCPEIPIPNLWSFGFPGGQSFMKPGNAA